MYGSDEDRHVADARSPDLHGNEPDRSSVAVLLIDAVNDLEFEGASGC